MSPKSDIMSAMKQICEEKEISFESVLDTVEVALAAAYRKDFGQKNQSIKVEFNPETGVIRAFDVKTVVENLPPDYFEKLALKEETRKQQKNAAAIAPKPSEPKPTTTDETATAEEPVEEERRFNPRTEITLDEARLIKPDAEINDEIRTELPVPGEFGRMAAQTAKQVIIQRIREVERDAIFQQYQGRQGELLYGFVQRIEGRLVFVDLGRVIGIMPPFEQVRSERYRLGQRLKVILISATPTAKGPELVVSRAHPNIVKLLFATEVPEIASGIVEVKAVAREAGARSKVAVVSHEENIDPVGSCVGQRGARVQTVINELDGEKIDIVPWHEDEATFITHALSPAKVQQVQLIDIENKIAQAFVRPDQLSLAIGRGGQNVRLASDLTGWKISVVPVNAKGEEIAPETETTESTTETATDEQTL